MNKTATIQTRIDPVIKKQAQEVLGDLHLTLSDAIGMFLSQVVMTKSIPFDIKIPNDLTIKTIEDSKIGKGVESFDNVEDLFEDLDN